VPARNGPLASWGIANGPRPLISIEGHPAARDTEWAREVPIASYEPVGVRSALCAKAEGLSRYLCAYRLVRLCTRSCMKLIFAITVGESRKG
jgi:hypothetical protein